MARPFDEPKSYHQMGSLASQTSLAGLYEDAGTKSKKGQRPRLPKIKSSPGNGVLAAARAESGKHHKKGNSTSATPTSPTFVPDYLLQSTGSSIPSAHAESYSLQQPKKKRSRTKIKPFLSKQSSQENLTIDLSRSAADNQGLAGVYKITSQPPIIRSDSASAHGVRPTVYHRRTTSAASQISSAPSHHSSRYVHPMRQAPRPYTPPAPGSYKDSFESASATPPISTVQNSNDPFESTTTSYASLPPTAPATMIAQSPNSTMTRRPHLPHIRTGSASRLAHSASQTNLPGTPSSLRQDFASPTSASAIGTARSSFETPSLRFRSRSNTASSPGPVDAAAQAATVAALRQQFQEKEAKKERKYAEAEARTAEKEAKRREKREGKAEARNEKRRVRREMEELRSERSRANTLESGGADSLSGSVASGIPYASPPRSRAPTVGSVVHSPPLPSSQQQAHPLSQSQERYRSYDASASSPRLYPARSSPSLMGGRSTSSKVGVTTSAAIPAGTGAGSNSLLPATSKTASPNNDSTINNKESMREKGKEKGEKVQSQWSLFWFRFRTAWLRFRRKIAGGGGGS